MTADASRSRTRSRLLLLLIVALFFSSFGVAALLRFTGWTPAQGKNFGELLTPPRDLGGLGLRRADGTPYPWNPETNTWRIVVAPPAACEMACSRTLDSLHRVWLLQGRKADRIDVLWFGDLPGQGPRFRKLLPMAPQPELLAALPGRATTDGVPVYLIDPSGFLVLHYPAGFDPVGLKKDLGKLVK